MSKTYRVAVIGRTGRGNYGHGIDTVWKAFPQIDLVAVADADDAGRAAAVKRLGVPRAYAGYRQMLAQEKPELVGIGPRHADQRAAMVTAAAEAGAHIYLEKPFALTLADADRMVDAVRRNKVKLQLAHQMRATPFALKAKALLEAGEIGEVEEIRARGKEDKRAGGEDMMVLGTHLFDMMRFFLGDPAWVTAHVAPMEVRTPTEPIGPVAGRRIAATFSFPNGVPGYFGSRQVADTHPLRFGTWIYGSKGVLYLANAIYPEGELRILRSPSWLPEPGRNWETLAIAPEPRHANELMVADLLRAIETGTRPCCNEDDGRWTIEMVHGIYAAEKSGNRLHFPLARRSHPLG